MLSTSWSMEALVYEPMKMDHSLGHIWLIPCEAISMQIRRDLLGRRTFMGEFP